MLDVFKRTHAETDYLATYTDENTYTPESEAALLKRLDESRNEVEILAVINGKLAGTAGIHPLGVKSKMRHRAEFGIGILKEYWGLGIGTELTNACIECARQAGYTQLELDVVAENSRAIALYKKCGFTEFGRNPRGFYSKYGCYQELVYMRIEL